VETQSSQIFTHELAEIGDSYPVEDNYICNLCNEFSSDAIRELKFHVIEDETQKWGEYVEVMSLHRCPGCGDAISSIGTVYCDTCTPSAEDRLPCLNCGRVRVNQDDPFCSSTCASERIQYGRPWIPPSNPSHEWLDQEHRLAEGIPYAAPFAENGRLVCRECYTFSDGEIQPFAMHVSRLHDLSWADYIEKYALRRCKVCDDPLRSLVPYYCSDNCQFNDEDPMKTCQREGCDNPVERRQVYCTRDCYLTSSSVD